MTIKEYLDRIPPMKADDGTTMKEAAAEFCEIWNNGSCRGYCINAMQRAGFSREQIEAVLSEMREAFEFVSVDDAEKIWIDF